MQNRQLPQGYNGRYSAQSVPDQRSLRGSAPVYYTSTGGWQSQGQNQTPVRRRPTQRVYLNKHQVKRLVIFLVLLGIAVGIYTISQKVQTRETNELLAPYADVFLPNVSVDGIDLAGKSFDEARAAVLTAVESRQNSWNLSLNYEGHTFITLNQELLGVTTDLSEVDRILHEAFAFGHSGSTEDRLRDLQTAAESGMSFYTTQSDMTDEYLDSVVAQIAAYFERQPTDAYLAGFDPDLADPFIVVDDIPGYHLNPDTLKEEILHQFASGRSGDFEIQPEILPAAVTTAAVRSRISLRGEGITLISTSSPDGRNANIDLSLGFINGVMLQPGETFSFNKVVGERSASRGFVEAIEYVNGVEVPGIGGGVCQSSTTVYLAALLSGLEIVERSPHSMKVSYTELGRDATVSGNRIDLKFRNNTEGTLYITAHMTLQPKSSKRYQCVVRIYGPSLGENVHYALRSETVDVLFPDEPILKNDMEGIYAVYEDEMYQYQTARDGYVISTFLQRVQDGEVTNEQKISTDTYRPQPDGYYVGIKSRDEEV